MKNNYKYKIHSLKNNSFEKYNNNQCCSNPHIQTREGEKVCINCGMVITKIIVNNEARAFTKEETDKRKRTEIKWREFGPRTIIPITRTDYRGHDINSKSKSLFFRLSKIQKSLVSCIERNLCVARPKLNIIASKMNIPDYIKETAWKIYSTVALKKLTIGRTINGFIAASLYVAIRIHEFPRLFEEVCKLSMTPRLIVHHSLGIIIKEVLPKYGLKYHPITPEKLIFRFGNELRLPMKIQIKAMNILIKAINKGLERNGKDPKGFAASVIYMAAKNTNERRTQAEVSEVAKITEVTLRKRIKEIKNKI